MANKKRLIDANELLRDAEDYGPIRGGLADMYDVKWLVDAQITVDAVEVVHGYWYEHHGITICSYCQSMFDTDLTMLQIPSTWKMPNYCPNCGAKMDGGAEP